MAYKRTNRVDFQVSIMAGIIVILSCTITFAITYIISYQDMIQSLQDRVFSIYNYLDEQLDKNTFDHIQSKADIDRDSYQEMQTLLQNVKESSGVMYLYTATHLDTDKYIYVVDGLSLADSEFRYPGDLIETEVKHRMREALSGEIIMPDKIKNTSWGHIFIAYLPIFRENEVLGVLGIEFDAGHQYRTFQMLIFSIPIAIGIFCIISCLIAFALFRRISNPSYRDLANTDMVTDLKNRNAFETDMKNLSHQKHLDIALLSIDLDDLKKVNDEKGHTEGDLYIISSARVLQKALASTSELYRTGGDEFVIIMYTLDLDSPEQLIQRIEMGLVEENLTSHNNMSLSIGFAFFDSNEDSNLMATFERADTNMYVLKRKKKNQRIAELERRKYI